MFVLALVALLFSSLVGAQQFIVNNDSSFVRIEASATNAEFKVQTTAGVFGTVLKTSLTRIDLEADLLAVSVKPLANKALSFTGATGASFTSTAGDANVSTTDRHVLKIASTEVVNATPNNTTFTGFVGTKNVSAATGDLSLRGALNVAVLGGTADDTKSFTFSYNKVLAHTVKKETVTSAGALTFSSAKEDVSFETSGTSKTLSFQSANGASQVSLSSTGISIIGLVGATATTKTDTMTASAGNKLVFGGENINIEATAGDVDFQSELLVAKTKTVGVSTDVNLVLGAPAGKKVIFTNDAVSTASFETTQILLATGAKLTSAGALNFASGATGKLVVQSGVATAKTNVSTDGVSAFTFSAQAADGIQFNLPLTIPSTAGTATFNGATTVTGLATFEGTVTLTSGTIKGSGDLTVEATKDVKLSAKSGTGKVIVGANGLTASNTGLEFGLPLTVTGATTVKGALLIKENATLLAGKTLSGKTLEFKTTAGDINVTTTNAASKVNLQVAGTTLATFAVAGTGSKLLGAAGYTTTSGKTTFGADATTGETEFKVDSKLDAINGSGLVVSTSASLKLSPTTKFELKPGGVAAITATTGPANVALGTKKFIFEGGINPAQAVELAATKTMTAAKGLTFSSQAAGDLTMNVATGKKYAFKQTVDALEMVAASTTVKAGYDLTFASTLSATGTSKVGDGALQWTAKGDVDMTGSETLQDAWNIDSKGTFTGTASGAGFVQLGTNGANHLNVKSTGVELLSTGDITFGNTATFKTTADITAAVTATTADTTVSDTITSTGSLELDGAAVALSDPTNSGNVIFKTSNAGSEITFGAGGQFKLTAGDLKAKTAGTDKITLESTGGTAVTIKDFRGAKATPGGALTMVAGIPQVYATAATLANSKTGVCWGSTPLVTGDFVTSCANNGNASVVFALSKAAPTLAASDVNVYFIELE